MRTYYTIKRINGHLYKYEITGFGHGRRQYRCLGSADVGVKAAGSSNTPESALTPVPEPQGRPDSNTSGGCTYVWVGLKPATTPDGLVSMVAEGITLAQGRLGCRPNVTRMHPETIALLVGQALPAGLRLVEDTRVQRGTALIGLEERGGE